jgi:hypothetical protein
VFIWERSDKEFAARAGQTVDLGDVAMKKTAD